MNRQRYFAEYITKDALDEACDKHGESWIDHIDYGVVTGNDLQTVVKEACSLNHVDNQCCYSIAREELINGLWQVVETYQMDIDFKSEVAA